MRFRDKVMQMAVAIILFSCDGNQVLPGLRKDYFGTTGQELIYRRDFRFTSDGEVYHSDTLSRIILGDTIVDSKVYKGVVQEAVGDEAVLSKLVRRDGAKYYARDYNRYLEFLEEERNFLDTEQTTGTSWSLNADGRKFEYIIDEIDATVTINNVEYSGVIRLRERHFYGNEVEEAWLTISHYYAKGIGEIYAYYPYPASGVYSDVEWTLIPNPE